MIKYEFFEDGKLLITSYIGDIDKELIKSYINFIFTKSKIFIVAGSGKTCSGVNSNKAESVFLLEENGDGVCCWVV